MSSCRGGGQQNGTHENKVKRVNPLSTLKQRLDRRECVGWLGASSLSVPDIDRGSVAQYFVVRAHGHSRPLPAPRLSPWLYLAFIP